MVVLAAYLEPSTPFRPRMDGLCGLACARSAAAATRRPTVGLGRLDQAKLTHEVPLVEIQVVLGYLAFLDGRDVAAA